MTNRTSTQTLRRGLAAAALSTILVVATAGAAGAAEPATDTVGGCQHCHIHKDLPRPTPQPQPQPEPEPEDDSSDDLPPCDRRTQPCPTDPPA